MMGSAAFAETGGHAVSDAVIAEQSAALAAATEGKGFGPQSPRDIGSKEGNNIRAFGEAPAASEMTLCDIHMHENAEYKGGEFTTYAGKLDDDPGVLVLSEFAGASQELVDALVVNPFDTRQVVDALTSALEMPQEERLLRLAGDAFARDEFRCGFLGAQFSG
jgi:hypothetical protein